MTITTNESSPTASVHASHEPRVEPSKENEKTEGKTSVTSVDATPVKLDNAKDFGFLPIPRRLRYDPARPLEFGLLMNIAFGFASTFSKYLATYNMNFMLNSYSGRESLLLPAVTEYVRSSI